MERKSHYFDDCPGFRMYGDKTKTIYALTIEDTTCGACRARICRVIAEADWKRLSSRDRDMIRRAALVAFGTRDNMYTVS